MTASWSTPKLWQDNKVVAEGDLELYVSANIKYLYEQFNLHKVEIDDSDIAAHGADSTFGSHIMLSVAGSYGGTGVAQEIETNIHILLVFIYCLVDDEQWITMEALPSSINHADGGNHAEESDVRIKGADASVIEVGQGGGNEANINGQTYYYLVFGYAE